MSELKALCHLRKFSSNAVSSKKDAPYNFISINNKCRFPNWKGETINVVYGNLISKCLPISLRILFICS